MFSRPKILFLVSLLFVALLNPYLPFKFFYHFSLFAFYICLSIHNNLSAEAQNVTGTYVCLQVLVNNSTYMKNSCVIANSLFVQGYNLKVQARFLCDVISRSLIV